MSNKYDKQLLAIGLLISFSLAGLLMAAIIISRRAEKTADNPAAITISMFLKSPDFKNNSLMPGKLTCDGLNTNPELVIAGVPDEAVSLALVAYDPDARPNGWTHWLLWNIPPLTNKILPATVPENAITGKNDFGQNNYGGPCPPAGTHHYIFTLYALDTALDLPATADRAALLAAMEGHLIDSVELTGLYGR